MSCDDTIEIFFLHISKGNEVTIQEGKSVIVITHIKTGTHTRNHLVNETKDAIVVAGTYFIKNSRLELNSQVLVGMLGNGYKAFFTCSIFNFQLYFVVRSVEAEFNDVFNLGTTNTKQLFARFNACVFS